MVLDNAPEDQFVFGNMVVDLAKYGVFVNGERVDLTVAEFDLLHRFCEAVDRIIDYDSLCLTAWNASGLLFKRRLAVAVCRIRAKLGDIDGYALKTVRGRGYGFLRQRDRGASHA